MWTKPPDGACRLWKKMSKIISPNGQPSPSVGPGAERRRLEAQLRTGSTASIVAHAHQAIVTTDEEGRIVGWNHHAEFLFGWSQIEAIGAYVADLIIPSEYRPRYREGVGRMLATRDAVVTNRLEVIAMRKGGEAFPIEMAVSAVKGRNGWEITGLMQDISERRAKEELFENAFHYAAIGMALVGLDGRFLKVNRALCQLVGYSAVQMCNLDFQAITHAEDLEADLGSLHRLLQGHIQSYEMDKRYLRADGSVVWVHLNVSLVAGPDGKPLHFRPGPGSVRAQGRRGPLSSAR
jgi:PAS domain S-box-containing protein